MRLISQLQQQELMILSCVRQGKLSKEAALDLLEKRTEIFGDDGTQAGPSTQGQGSHSSVSSLAEKGKAVFYSIGNKRYPD